MLWEDFLLTNTSLEIVFRRLFFFLFDIDMDWQRAYLEELEVMLFWLLLEAWIDDT